jgi:hypothetical protein
MRNDDNDANVANDFPNLLYKGPHWTTWVTVALLSLFVFCFVFYVVVVASNSSSGLEPLTILATIAFFTTILAIGSIAVSFWLYRWRKALLGNQDAMLPETLGKSLNSLGIGAHDVATAIKTFQNSVNNQVLLNTQEISSMTTTFMTMQDVISSREKEISRLKSGFDAVLFKRFLARFIRLDQSLDEIIGERTDPDKDLIFLSRLLQDALDECGVEKICPDLGSDYRQLDKLVSDNPLHEAAELPESNFKISSVTHQAYVLTTGEQVEVIVPSKVTIFMCTTGT